MKRSHILHILMMAVVAFACGACSDDPFGFNTPDFDNPELEIVAGEFPRLSTRAAAIDENTVSEIWIGIYDETGNRIFSHTEPDMAFNSANDAERRLKLRLNDEVRKASDMTMYVVANRNSSMTDAATAKESDLPAIRDAGSSDMAMTWSKKLSSFKDIAGSEVRLLRNMGKLSAKKDASAKPLTDFSIYSVTLWKGRNEGIIFESGLSDGRDIVTGDPADGAFSYPVKNEAGNLCVIIEGGYNGEKSFYRADFKDAAGKNLDFNRNYWYEVVVKDATAKGYDSMEAAAGGEENTVVDIFDHRPDIFTLTSDGRNLLGTSDTIVWKKNVALYDIRVRITGKNADPSDVNVEIPAQFASWISDPGTSSAQMNVTTGTDNGSDYKIFNRRIELQENIGGGERIGYVDVVWNGLRRRVVVAQNYTADVSTATVSLTMTDTHEGTVIKNDYFSFVENDLFGISPDCNGNMYRNRGLHFPMGYKKTHDGSDYAKYSYAISLKSLDEEAYSWLNTATFEVVIDDAYFKNQISVSPVSGNFKNAVINVSWKGTGSDKTYRASSKALKIKITGSIGGVTKEAEISYDLYNTGFFHHDTSSNQIAVGPYIPVAGWYYYEAIPVNVGSDTRLWLDRNIGAKASGVYLQNASGASYFDGKDVWPYKDDSRGGMYGAAYSSGGTLHINTTNLCPPGFKVPSINEWMEMTGGSQFKTENIYDLGVSYWATCLKTGEKTVYFPKSRYVMPGGTAYSGSDASGYYWTSTPAVGISGTGGEAGYWVQYLKFEKSSRSFGRQRISQENNTNAKLGMSVRCIDDMEERNNLTRLNFSIAGYTHIYLYYKDSNGVKVGLNSWPGDMVTVYGDHLSQYRDRYYDYTFETYASLPSKLYAILTKVDGTAVRGYYDMNGDHAFNPSDFTQIDGKEFYVVTAKDRVWIPAKSSGTDPEPTIVTRKYRLYWSKDMNNIHVYKIKIENAHTGELIYDIQDCSLSNAYGGACHYFDFELEANSVAELDNMVIIPKFTGNYGTGWFIKAWDSGRIPCHVGRDNSWFKMDDNINRYIYGNEKDQLIYTTFKKIE